MKKLLPFLVLVLPGMVWLAVADGGNAEEQNKTIVRRFVEEVQNRHDVGAMDRFFSVNFINHSEIPGLPSNLGGAKQFHTMFFAAFPDLHATIHSQVAEGDKVVTHKTFHGTHQGTFMGIPATGKRISYEVIDILTVVEGMITEHWVVGDHLGLMKQLGVIPTQP
jgi:steroid delta-isomerase-like uncharacterized protein